MASSKWRADDCLPRGLSGDGIVHLIPAFLAEGVIELTAVALAANRLAVS